MKDKVAPPSVFFPVVATYVVLMIRRYARQSS